MKTQTNIFFKTNYKFHINKYYIFILKINFRTIQLKNKLRKKKIYFKKYPLKTF